MTTRDELREKVARAIYEDRNGRGCRAFSTLPAEHRVCYLSDARAAIGVMQTEIAERIAAAEALFRAASKQAYARPTACSLDLLKAIGDWRELPASPLAGDAK